MTHKKNIEVEVRSFITNEQYENLIERFKQEAQFLGEDEQITYYFDTPQDLRIQKNNTYSKTWLKKGNLHDDHREEIEVRCAKEDFEKLEQLYLSLGYRVAIKWFRKRHSFTWGDISLAIDHTKGYGYIIELEKMAGEDEKEQVLVELRQAMEKLSIPQTPKEEFERRYAYYKENWRSLTA